MSIVDSSAPPPSSYSSVRSLGIVAPIAAVVIAAEMLLFCALHLSRMRMNGQVVYWVVVALSAICVVGDGGRRCPQ
jgi:hypothetical protein